MSSTTHQALYRRWRAQTFGQIVGQEAVVTTLRNAVRSARVAHAYLFVGPRGTGKTSLARILAKAINCLAPVDGEPCDACLACVAIREGRALDVSEMDAASNNRVDDMRELLPRIYTAPSDLTRKVFIVDEVQRIKEGWDVLLKALEEPPDHVVFVFCTTDSSQIRPAVLSRVQRFDFRRLTLEEIEGKLARILEADGRPADPDAVELVARLADGGMRDAESMLDQLLSSGLERVTAEQVRELLGLADVDTVAAFVDALVQGDALGGIAILDSLEAHGRDLRAFIDQAIGSLRSSLVTVLGMGGGPAALRRAAQPLSVAARRLAAIDPARSGPGGLRFQLELALLAPPEVPAASVAPPVAEVVAVAAPVAPKPAPPPGGSRGSVSPSPRRDAESPPPAGPTNRARSTTREARLPEGVTVSAGEAEAALPEGAEPEAAETEIAVPEVAVSEAMAAPGVATSAVASGDAERLAELIARWREVVALVSANPPAKPLIEACRPVAVEGPVVTLGFPEGKAFLRDAAERRKSAFEDGVSRVLGVPVAVRCVATNLAAVEAPEDPEAARLLAEVRRIYADELMDVGEVT